MKRRNFITGATLLTAATVSGGTGAAFASPVSHSGLSQPRAASLPESVMADSDFDRLIKALDNVPEDLKNADPKTTPDYERNLSKALNGLRLARSSDIANRVSWIHCGIEVAKIIIQYGVPIAKVIKWIKDARKLWGSVRGILRAIHNGNAIVDIGEEAVKLIEMLLGFDSVITACFS
ncbi:hypothetical protein [Devriesea agamarum]|uniref:hypothetical protein n=1 Tax=Devriesea agamarum TaxID=472569 RepID=UPI0012EEB502|nr:hypothetical protein [Devriesea agamarum]